MSKKVLIDLLKLRDFEACSDEAVEQQLLKGGAFKTIRELATFKLTCRRCEDAPCINVCPSEALEKDDNGFISRALNLCIRCKSCVAICPFGTIMNDLFETKTSDYSYFDLSDEKEMQEFADAYPESAVSIVEMEESKDSNVFQLSERVLVKEFIWDGD